jgi:uncharacterized membrane protein YccC
MWAVIATVFVYRESYQKSMRAALSRMSATVLSFALCLIYLLILPFYPVGMAALIGIGAVILTLVDRAEDVITAGITTVVVMVMAGIAPQHAWTQPILRLVDTNIGMAVGIAAAWGGMKLGSQPKGAARRLRPNLDADWLGNRQSSRSARSAKWFPLLSARLWEK